jgi:hypothetical protein
VTLCVYALTNAQAGRLGARGLDGERLQLLTSGAIGAIVGEMAEVPRPTIENLQRYGNVVGRLASHRVALLPARFGTCLERSELFFVLRSRERLLRAALSRVRHRVQMTVRVRENASESGEGNLRPDQDASTRHTGAGVALRPGAGGVDAGDSPRVPTPGRTARRTAAGAGSRYLRQRASLMANANQMEGCALVRAAVRPFVRDELVERRPDVTTVYHLVPRTSVGAYQRALERTPVPSPLRIVVTGPWPPYAFASW